MRMRAELAFIAGPLGVDSMPLGQRGMLCVTVAGAADLPALQDQTNLFCVLQFDNTQAQTALCCGPLCVTLLARLDRSLLLFNCPTLLSQVHLGRTLQV